MMNFKLLDSGSIYVLRRTNSQYATDSKVIQNTSMTIFSNIFFYSQLRQ